MQGCLTSLKVAINMLKITNCTFTESKTDNKVAFTYSDDVKEAKCSCSHEWVPKSSFDYVCRKCNKP